MTCCHKFGWYRYDRQSVNLEEGYADYEHMVATARAHGIPGLTRHALLSIKIGL